MFFFLIILMVQDPAQAGAANEKHLSSFGISKSFWQKPQLCGPNCLYVFLRMHDIDVKHEDIIAESQITQIGMSLNRLSNLSKRFGISARAYKANKIPIEMLPVIAHLGEGNANHYIVVTDVKNRQVTAVDGTSGEKVQLSLDWFEQNWSGAMLVAESINEYSAVGWLLLGVGVLLLVLAIFSYRSRSNSILAKLHLIKAN